jgi:hypothetical protein
MALSKIITPSVVYNNNCTATILGTFKLSGGSQQEIGFEFERESSGLLPDNTPEIYKIIQTTPIVYLVVFDSDIATTDTANGLFPYAPTEYDRREFLYFGSDNLTQYTSAVQIGVLDFNPSPIAPGTTSTAVLNTADTTGGSIFNQQQIKGNYKDATAPLRTATRDAGLGTSERANINKAMRFNIPYVPYPETVNRPLPTFQIGLFTIVGANKSGITVSRYSTDYTVSIPYKIYRYAPSKDSFISSEIVSNFLIRTVVETGTIPILIQGSPLCPVNSNGGGGNGGGGNETIPPVPDDGSCHNDGKHRRIYLK